MVIPLIALLHPSYKEIYANFWILIKHKVFLTFILSFIFIFFIGIIYAIYRGTYDYGLVAPILHSIFSIPACCIIASYLSTFRNSNSYKNNVLPLYKFLSYLLFIQCFIIIAMLISPELAEKINLLTKTPAQIERMSTYVGARGLGISGSVAYGLAVILTTLFYFVFFLKLIVQNYKLYNVDYILFFISCVAILSAGRTAIIGILLFTASYILINLHNRKIKDLVKIIILMPVFIIITSYILLNSDIPAVTALVNYVFQPIEHYKNYGNFQVSSLEGLSNMYFLPSDLTMLIGDARWLNGLGGYYEGVDAGYMRFLLYFGAPISLLIYLLWIFIIYFSYIRIKKVLDFAFVFFTSFLLMSFILHYKGEVIFINVGFNKVVYVMIFYFLINSFKKPTPIN